MPVTPSELLDRYHQHLSEQNPHKVTSKQIWGLYNIDNTPDSEKPVSSAMAAELARKVNVSDIYNSTEESSSVNLATVPWSAAQAYVMNNTIDAWTKQDLSEITSRIEWCEHNV